MELDTDTFLVTVYCLVDEIYTQQFAAHKPRRRGRKPEMSDSEVLTLGLLAQWQRSRSEREFLRTTRKLLAPYFPRWLSVTHSQRKTPDVALIAGAVAGYLIALAIHLLPKNGPAGAILLNMAIFGAVVSYAMQCLSFILLRTRHANIPRPYTSPVGLIGA